MKTNFTERTRMATRCWFAMTAVTNPLLFKKETYENRCRRNGNEQALFDKYFLEILSKKMHNYLL